MQMMQMNLRYPKAYVIREHPEKQIAVFKKLLPGLDAGEIARMLPYAVPAGAEDCFVVPKPHFASSLADAAKFMLVCLGIGQAEITKIPLVMLQWSERTESALSAVSKLQKGDFWLIPVQLGFSRRGMSVEEVREGYEENEFGLDLYLAAACVVSHSGRLTGGHNELGIDCPGNKDLHGFGSPKTPCLNSFEGRRRCLLNRVAESSVGYGSATGFVPQ